MPPMRPPPRARTRAQTRAQTLATTSAAKPEGSVAPRTEKAAKKPSTQIAKKASAKKRAAEKDDDDGVKAPPRKKRAAEKDDDDGAKAPPRKKRAAEKDDDDGVKAPPRKKRAAEKDDDGAKAPPRKKRAAKSQDAASRAKTQAAKASPPQQRQPSAAASSEKSAQEIGKPKDESRPEKAPRKRSLKEAEDVVVTQSQAASNKRQKHEVADEAKNAETIDTVGGANNQKKQAGDYKEKTTGAASQMKVTSPPPEITARAKTPARMSSPSTANTSNDSEIQKAKKLSLNEATANTFDQSEIDKAIELSIVEQSLNPPIAPRQSNSVPASPLRALAPAPPRTTPEHHEPLQNQPRQGSCAPAPDISEKHTEKMIQDAADAYHQLCNLTSTNWIHPGHIINSIAGIPFAGKQTKLTQAERKAAADATFGDWRARYPRDITIIKRFHRERPLRMPTESPQPWLKELAEQIATKSAHAMQEEFKKAIESIQADELLDLSKSVQQMAKGDWKGTLEELFQRSLEHYQDKFEKKQQKLQSNVMKLKDLALCMKTTIPKVLPQALKDYQERKQGQDWLEHWIKWLTDYEILEKRAGGVMEPVHIKDNIYEV